MFDIGAFELLVVAVVAILAIGKDDIPTAMRMVGRWVGKFRRVSGHFRTGLDAMVREAEMEDMDKKWREQNDRIMAQYPDEEMTGVSEAPGAMSAAEAREAQAGGREPGPDKPAAETAPPPKVGD